MLSSLRRAFSLGEGGNDMPANLVRHRGCQKAGAEKDDRVENDISLRHEIAIVIERRDPEREEVNGCIASGAYGAGNNAQQRAKTQRGKNDE